MLAWLLGSVGIIAVALVLDRVLLRMEAKGWIFYRRSRGRWRGSWYHMVETHSMFDPSIRQVLEATVQEGLIQDESGDPPGPDSDDDTSAIEPPGTGTPPERDD